MSSMGKLDTTAQDRIKQNANPNWKTFGDIEGVPVGMHFADRKELYDAGVHGRLVWGIHGTEGDGAFSIVVNGGYEDDDDNGDHLIYTGHGKGKDKFGNIVQWANGVQIGDQQWRQGNLSLLVSWEESKPVRVIRGPEGNSKYCPLEGYRYDGLYHVVRCWEGTGKVGHKMCKFELRRFPNQPPLQRPYEHRVWWNPHQTFHRRELGRKTAPSQVNVLRRRLENKRKLMGLGRS